MGGALLDLLAPCIDSCTHAVNGISQAQHGLISYRIFVYHCMTQDTEPS